MLQSSASQGCGVPRDFFRWCSIGSPHGDKMLLCQMRWILADGGSCGWNCDSWGCYVGSFWL